MPLLQRLRAKQYVSNSIKKIRKREMEGERRREAQAVPAVPPPRFQLAAAVGAKPFPGLGLAVGAGMARHGTARTGPYRAVPCRGRRPGDCGELPGAAEGRGRPQPFPCSPRRWWQGGNGDNAEGVAGLRGPRGGDCTPSRSAPRGREGQSRVAGGAAGRPGEGRRPRGNGRRKVSPEGVGVGGGGATRSLSPRSPIPGG